MKYLLVFLVVMLVAWRWRTGRSSEQLERRTKSSSPPAPLTMVCCDHCGVHLPQSDAVSGVRGTYCSTAHRQKAEP